MNKITNFEEAKKVLRAYVPSDTSVRVYELSKMVSLMQFLGNPQDNLKIVHVAGTSGKTSTSYYAASLLKQAGYKVGLTASPHVDEINERVQINLVPLPEPEYCQYLNGFLEIINKYSGDFSYFEILMAFAYWVFNKLKVDYAVIEVGLGGLIDATNVANRADKVCIITDIGIDHTKVLGTTLKEITAHKAGIIYENNAVFMNKQNMAVMEAVGEVCNRKNANLFVNHGSSNYEFLSNLPIFQQRNWSLALEAVNYILGREDKPQFTKQQMLESTKIIVPGRMEIFKINEKTIIVDGSHNKQKISALVESLKRNYPDQKLATLISLGHNKSDSLEDSLGALTAISVSITATKFNFGQDEFRAPIEPSEIVGTLSKMGFKHAKIENNPEKAFYDLIESDAPIILVTGSFFLLNHIRPIIRKLQTESCHE